MTITTITIWVAYASGVLIGYKIADYRWRKRIKDMQNTMTTDSPAHGVPLREGTIRKGGQNEPSTPPPASRPPTTAEMQSRLDDHLKRLERATVLRDSGAMTNQGHLDVLNEIRAEVGLPALQMPPETSVYAVLARLRLDVKA